MRVILTPDDLKKGDLVPENGYFPAEIVNYEEKESSGDKSTNCIFHFKILDGPAKGISPNALFNEKALGFGKELWAVLFGPPDKEKGYELSSEIFKAQIGKKVKIYVQRAKGDKPGSAEFNKVTGFMPLT